MLKKRYSPTPLKVLNYAAWKILFRFYERNWIEFSPSISNKVFRQYNFNCTAFHVQSSWKVLGQYEFVSYRFIFQLSLALILQLNAVSTELSNFHPKKAASNTKSSAESRSETKNRVSSFFSTVFRQHSND